MRARVVIAYEGRERRFPERRLAAYAAEVFARGGWIKIIDDFGGHLSEVYIPSPLGTWRKEPPTVEEVRACPFWHWRAAPKSHQIVGLTIQHGTVVFAASHPHVLVEEWGGEWAPCLAPGEPDPTQ